VQLRLTVWYDMFSFAIDGFAAQWLSTSHCIRHLFQSSVLYSATSITPATDFGVMGGHALIGCVLHSLSLAICCLPQLPDKSLVYHISTHPSSGSPSDMDYVESKSTGSGSAVPTTSTTPACAPRRRRETVGHYQHVYRFLVPSPTRSGSTRVALFAESCASLLYQLGPPFPAL
jgi:hypothetical protein